MTEEELRAIEARYEELERETWRKPHDPEAFNKAVNTFDNHSRNDLLSLVAEVRRLQEKNKELLKMALIANSSDCYDLCGPEHSDWCKEERKILGLD